MGNILNPKTYYLFKNFYQFIMADLSDDLNFDIKLDNNDAAKQERHAVPSKKIGTGELPSATSQ